MSLKKNNNKTKIITDQKLFFNLNARKGRKESSLNKFFIRYVNQEQCYGFEWISNCKSILDYGCGTGTSIDSFLNKRNLNNYHFYGVDIAKDAIKEVRQKYPQFKFYKIVNNKIPQIRNNSTDAVFMFHVLHHSYSHLGIFKEVHSKLKKGGKFLINDLTSNNIINKLGRSFFIRFPQFIKNKFNDDLVIDGQIPEKYKVNVDLVISQLRKTGFTIKEVGYGHLFFFVFIWIDRFIPLSKINLIRIFYKKLIELEEYLLRYEFFKKQAEVFYIKCLKK